MSDNYSQMQLLQLVTAPEGNIPAEADLGNGERLVAAPGDKRNPMLNQVVLARFLEICDSSELKTFRLVSKQWYSISLNRWRAEMQVIIEPSKVGNMTQLFTEQMMEKPFKSYLLRGIVFGNRQLPGWLLFSEHPIPTFLEKCGPSIRRLELDNCKIHGGGLRRHLSSMTYLEEFIVRDSSFDVLVQLKIVGWRNWQPPPNLKSVKIHIEPGEFYSALVVREYPGSIDCKSGWTMFMTDAGNKSVCVSL